MKKIICNICGSTLIHDRIDDGLIVTTITADGDTLEVHNRSDGEDRVYCSNDSHHKLDDELVGLVLDIVQ